MGLKIVKYDDETLNSMDEASKITYLATKTNFAAIPFKPKLKPKSAWATPFVTGHKYRFHFGETGINFESLRLTTSVRWEETDKPLYFVHNFTDVRAAIDVQLDGKVIANNTIGATQAEWEMG